MHKQTTIERLHPHATRLSIVTRNEPKHSVSAHKVLQKILKLIPTAQSLGSDVRATNCGFEHKVEALLEHAVHAHRSGKDTGSLQVVIHVDERDPDQHESELFTTASVYRWADEELNIQIPDWGPPTLQPEQSDDVATGTSKPVRYTDNEKEKHQVIIMILLKLLSANLNNKYRDNGRPNFAQIAQLVASECDKSRVDVIGLSGESLRKKFSEAWKTGLGSISKK